MNKIEADERIFIASLDGREIKVEQCIAAGADVNKPIHNGATPLFAASQEGNERVVDMLCGWS